MRLLVQVVESVFTVFLPSVPPPFFLHHSTSVLGKKILQSICYQFSSKYVLKFGISEICVCHM